ncbi:unnamed protein product [Linum trigynum]|uniref:Uncharacterized protein n=1 Tax=Linum trigynum TaxID=586398 RepID=A0AAV2DEL1_9ROSI
MIGRSWDVLHEQRRSARPGPSCTTAQGGSCKDNGTVKGSRDVQFDPRPCRVAIDLARAKPGYARSCHDRARALKES